jgi:hypothetical protein
MWDVGYCKLGKKQQVGRDEGSGYYYIEWKEVQGTET